MSTILATWEAQKDLHLRLAWAKRFFRRLLNGKKMGVVTYTSCYPSNNRKFQIRGLQSRLDWQKSRTYLQNNQKKRVKV
jgi:hypothetical protein